ncbi:MAG: hypothetical protein RMY28_036195 [Nostoc sp. ChiSLP01]|nr:hypothetical protein [Nostoc sp. CmiSLP01]
MPPRLFGGTAYKRERSQSCQGCDRFNFCNYTITVAVDLMQK